jgi:hypothetical protein
MEPPIGQDKFLTTKNTKSHEKESETGPDRQGVRPLVARSPFVFFVFFVVENPLRPPFLLVGIGSFDPWW